LALLLRGSDESQLQYACELLLSEQPVALPTETVYGLAGLARSPKSLARIFELKARPQFDPLIVHTLEVGRISTFAKISDPLVFKVLEKFWPGPLTVLFERKKEIIPDLCTAGLDEVAVRSPVHPVFRNILKKIGQELAAPSANRFGHVSPVVARDCIKELGPFGLEAVVDGGRSEHGIESTIVRFNSDSKKLEVLRWGACDVSKIIETLGAGWQTVDLTVSNQVKNSSLASPGLVENHYAPRNKKVYACESQWNLKEYLQSQRMGLAETYIVYSFSSMLEKFSDAYKVKVISRSGSAVEVAYELFSLVREIDETEPDNVCKNIVFVMPPESSSGLNNAIRDRVKRASINKGIWNHS
jgi:L-threonylcarbamoyladenylate synthase